MTNKEYIDIFYEYLHSIYGKKQKPIFICDKNRKYPETLLPSTIYFTFSENDNYPGQVLYQLSHEFFHYESLDNNIADVIDEIFAEGFSFYILNKYNGINFNFKEYYKCFLDLHEENPITYDNMNQNAESNRHLHHKYSKDIYQILLNDKHRVKDLINFKRKNIKWIDDIINKIKNLEEIDE